MDTEIRYSLADLARVVAVTPRTVRYYIVQGLLPGANDSGPAAWYDERHLQRLRLIRELQRQHLPLAEIRARLGSLGDAEVAELLEAHGSGPTEHEGSALDYIRSVLGTSGSEVRPRFMRLASPSMPEVEAQRFRSQAPPALPGPQALSELVGVIDAEPPPSAPTSAAPDPAAPTAERSQWDRIALTTDIELHVRRPLSRLDHRRVERLITIARQVLGEEKP